MLSGGVLALSVLTGGSVAIASEVSEPSEPAGSAESAPPVAAQQRMSDDAARSFLAAVTEGVILPVYRELDDNAAKLAATTEQFCAQPDANGLKTVRADWAATLSSWEQSASFLFGPAVEEEIDFTIYFKPVKKAVIKGLLSSETAVTPEMVAQSGVGGQGLATLEYLLFDREQDDKQLLAVFSGTDEQRCSYLVAAAALLAKNLHTIADSWHRQENSYAEAVVSAGAGSTYFTAAYQPVELLINRFYQTIQAVEIKKLGVPLGLRGSRSGEPKAYPHKLEAWRSGYSLANIRSALQGLQRLLAAGGILEWLRTHEQAELAEQLETRLQQLLATEWDSTDLFQMLADKPEAVKPFYEQVQALSATVRDGLAPALGVQLGFNDNDGD
jgi:predicted lipoprotein